MTVANRPARAVVAVAAMATAAPAEFALRLVLLVPLPAAAAVFIVAVVVADNVFLARVSKPSIVQGAHKVAIKNEIKMAMSDHRDGFCKDMATMILSFFLSSSSSSHTSTIRFFFKRCDFKRQW